METYKEFKRKILEECKEKYGEDIKVEIEEIEAFYDILVPLVKVYNKNGELIDEFIPSF